MKFNKKLTNLRKINNLSQETLAEKVGVSRQAVSKWENGTSYPDMSTILNLCKILNCNLEDLLDDGATGKKELKSKFNFNIWINSVLSFITKSYNMFISMTFKEKIKCIFELIFIILILVCFGVLIFNVLSSITIKLFTFIPSYISNVITNIFDTIYYAVVILFGFIVFIHMFKIRYLDYYITIEDNNTDTKTIEKEVKDNYEKKKVPKIIIRDAKHSSYNILSGFIKLMLIFIKFFVLLICIPIIFIFIMSVCSTFISLIWIKYGIIFLGSSLLLLGITLICYVFIELIVIFIFNLLYSFKRSFIIFISGLLLLGIGLGLSITEYLSFTSIKDSYDTKNLVLRVNNNTILEELNNEVIVIDDDIKDVIIETSYIKGANISLENYDSNDFSINWINYKTDPIKVINIILNDIKNKKYRQIDNDSYVINKITLSNNNYKLLKKNLDSLNYYNYYE